MGLTISESSSGKPRRTKFSIVTDALNAVGTSFVLFIMIVMIVDIGGRVIFNQPLAGVPELVTMSIVAIVFLQLPHAVASGGIIRSDLWIAMVGRRRPRLAAFLEAIYDGVGLCIFAVMAYAAIPFVIEAYASNDQFGTPGIFLFPKWPLRLVFAIGCLAVIVQFSISIADHLRNVFANVASHDTNEPADLTAEKFL